MNYLSITSRTGHFNWANPQEEYTSTTISIKDVETGETILLDDKRMATSLRTEYDESENVPLSEKAIELLRECISKMFIDTSRPEKEAILKYLEENGQEVDIGTKRRRSMVLEKEIEARQKELESLKQ